MIKLILLLVVAAVVAPFFIKGPTGQPLMTLDKLLKPTQQEQAAAQPEKPETRTIYKWQDKDGVWHFSTEPVKGSDVQTITVSGAINIMPSIASAPTNASQAEPSTATVPSLPTGLTTISPEKITQAMEAAAHLQETVDQRKEAIDQAIKGKVPGS